MKLINFSMINYKCNTDDIDFIRVYETANKFQLHNSMLDGKTMQGIVLRFEMCLNFLVKKCVFRNINKGSNANGGEAIRIGVSSMEKKTSNGIIDQCYFTNCVSDPEIVSVKNSGNTIKNCVFENNGDSKLVLRHTHNDIVENCYFSGSGIRVYGTKHQIRSIQLVNNANILLDDKKGDSYVVAQDVKVDTVYYDNVKTPVTNDGINCTVTNVKKELKITKQMLFDGTFDDIKPSPDPTPLPPTPVEPKKEEIITEIIPAVVDKKKIYKLNKDLTDAQRKELMK
jgi:hypothetical protein